MGAAIMKVDDEVKLKQVLLAGEGRFRMRRWFGISLPIVLTVIVFAVLVTSFVYFLTIDNTTNQAEVNLEQTTSKLSYELEIIFKNSQNLANSLAYQPDVIAYLEDPENEGGQHLLRHLNILNIGDHYSAIYVMNDKGEALVSTDASFVGQNYSFRPYFQNALAGQPYVYMAVGVTSKQPGYYFSHPVINNEGIIGVVVAKLRPEVVHLLLPGSFPEGVDAMLVNKQGVVIFSNKADLIYHSLGEFDLIEKQEIVENRVFENIVIGSLGWQPVQETVGNYSQPSSLEIDSGAGQKILFNVARVDEYDFFIVSKVNTTDIVAAALAMVKLVAILMVVASFVLLAVISFFTTGYLAPLFEINKAVQEYGRGNFDYDLDIKTGDEREQLARLLKLMAQDLKRARSGTKLEVDKRAKQLEEINKVLIGRELKMIELKKEIANLEAEAKKK